MGESQHKKVPNVAVAAAVNVDGYLRNASKRLRIPSALGGRGTRRRLAMVTSANDHQSLETKVDVDAGAGVDEWDEVVLPNAVVSGVVKDEKRRKEEDETANDQGQIQQQKMEPKGEVATNTPADSTVKAEALPIGNYGEGNNNADHGGGTQSLLGDAVRPPLANTPMRRWGQRDPAYERMLEQQQLLAAKRRLERIRRAAEEISLLIFAVMRGRTILQESHHPQLVRKLLRIRTGEGCVWNAHPLLYAVRRATDCYRQALDVTARRPLLTPCWVTASKDTVKNHTSASIMALIDGITSVFTMEDAVGSAVLSNWTAPIEIRFFFNRLSKSHPSLVSPGAKIAVPHSLYLCAAFISLASVSGLSCRLVVAVRKAEEHPSTADVSASISKETMPLFMPRTKRPRKDASGGDYVSQKLPSSCFWVEVWCPQRESFISVNPCEGCTTLWGSPYTFSVGGDVVVDVTPRYSIKYSSAFSHRLGCCEKYRFIWKHLQWNDNREASEVVVDAFCKNMTRRTRERLTRERKQLHSLMYAEEVPKTITALKKHPLFVLENELARYEGIYPKDSSTIVGSVKGHVVYKRSAVVHLRSRDGWLREGRCVLSEEEPPYKLVAPPASRPFVSPSAFFGVWQTKPFEPQPLRSDGSLPRHGKTQWYVILDKPTPAGIVHIRHPNIARVARRVEVDFGLAVTGFRRRRLDERRFAHWESVIDGIVVKGTDAPSLLRAYEDWRRLTEEQEAAKRRQRANRWWLHFTQRMLSMLRIREQYLEGAMHGALSSC